MSTSLGVGCSSWQSGGKSTLDNKAKPSRHSKIGLMLIPSLFSFFNFFFPFKKARVFWVVCLSLCKHCAQSFFCHGGTLQIWEEVMLSWGTDVTKCQLDKASATSPPSLHCSTQTEEDTKASVHLYIYYCHILKLVGDLCPLPLKKLLISLQLFEQSGYMSIYWWSVGLIHKNFICDRTSECFWPIHIKYSRPGDKAWSKLG